MKQSYIYRIFASLCFLTLATACGLEGQEECVPCRKARTVNVRVAGTHPASELETPLYLFRRPAGSQKEYLYARNCGTVADGDALKLPLSEIKAYDYRFLMIAQRQGTPWLSMQTAAGTPFEPGSAWVDLRLVSASGQAASDGYCGFTDISGDMLLQDGSVRLTLKRIAGQILFDFFRTAGSLSQPEGVLSDDVASVADRINRIVIEYENTTTALRFDADGLLTAAAYASEPLLQTISPEATDFKVTLPQAEKGLEVYDAALRGSLRIAGAFLLPSDSKLRIRMSFTYYDTTPICGNTHTGDHTAACYGQQQLSLTLPAAASEQGLPVAADCFTVNRAGLRCDRIIDVPVGGSIETDFGWL